MIKYPFAIQILIDEFNKLPGIGPKTAERFVFYLLKQPREELAKLSMALTKIKGSITTCQVCQNFAEKSPCYICGDPKRDQTTVCVVAEPQDLLAIEKTGYQGRYHILNGLLDSANGITPDQLKIKELTERIKSNNIKEIILGLNPNLEGETTVLYLKKMLTPFKIKITRLARGLPMGSELEYADEITLADALKGRREI